MGDRAHPMIGMRHVRSWCTRHIMVSAGDLATVALGGSPEGRFSAQAGAGLRSAGTGGCGFWLW
jgi:hypothetical protein